jgi:serine/alanine adding enzyme
MSFKIVPINIDHYPSWNGFTDNQKYSSLYNLSEWHKIIQTIYGHNSYYFIANNIDYKVDLLINSTTNNKIDHKNIIGTLSFVKIKSWFFGNHLISIPYFDSGGILTTDKQAEIAFLVKSVDLAENLGVTHIELRQNYPLLSAKDFVSNQAVWNLCLSNKKVRMVLDIHENSELLMKSFASKLRSQIRKPIKEGLIAKIGGVELVDDFYHVFAENMRDLGSPVHSKKFIAETLKAFPKTANVFVVYGNQKPLAGSVAIGFKDTLSNPWASSLRRYSHLAPNMLLYWSMLEFACQQGYKRFDFGRSTPGEGTYKFKEQWGAKPEPLYWYRLSKSGDQSWGSQPDKNKMSKAIEYWKKLPVPLTKIIGPRIRKYISL